MRKVRLLSIEKGKNKAMPDKEKLNIGELFSNLGDKEAKRNPQGFHTLSFDNTKVKLGDKSVEMKSEGWKALTIMLKTTSPTLMAKRLVAIAVNNASS